MRSHGATPQRSGASTPACVLALLLLTQLFGCGAGRTPAVCADGDKACAGKAVREHAVRRLDYWMPVLSKPVAERIGPAPPELIDYIRMDNIKNGFPNKPRPASVSPAFMQDVYAAIDEMPASVKRGLAKNLLGIYFIEDLGGTGFTEQILDARGKPVAGIVVLDAAVLNQRSANAWATWKEGSPFLDEPGYALRAEIEEAPHDDRMHAIQYILLHEFGHVLAIGGRFHPSWDDEARDYPKDADYPFFALSWAASVADNRYHTLFDRDFPHRADVVFYFGAKLSGDEMLDTYAHLERTNFATLYSVNNPGDDFAEAFANYAHVVLMHKPYRITLAADGKILKVYEACWAQRRCAEKRKILEQLLGGA